VRCVITGGRGFAGRHLARHLLDTSHDVTVLDRAELDVVDAAAVARQFAAQRPEVVFHLAALTHVGESYDDPAGVARVNVDGTLAVLHAAADTGARVVVVVGSAEEYGAVPPGEVPIAETRPPAPVSPYGASKAEATRRAGEFARDAPLRVVIARPFNHTGPEQSTRFLIPALAARIAAAELRGGDHVAVGNLDPVRDIGDVRDVVRAYALLAERGEPGEIYNIATGRGVTVRDVARLLIDQATVPLELRVDPGLVRPVDIPILVGDHRKLTAATGWAPRIPLAQTLRDVLVAARSRISAAPTPGPSPGG
jgi:GDP-4-dehydro-6-deoxy-D-mannose reductase